MPCELFDKVLGGAYREVLALTVTFGAIQENCLGAAAAKMTASGRRFWLAPVVIH
jgi:hypothetical protein